jgi:hypothetical protein
MTKPVARDLIYRRRKFQPEIIELQALVAPYAQSRRQCSQSSGTTLDAGRES